MYLIGIVRLDLSVSKIKFIKKEEKENYFYKKSLEWEVIHNSNYFVYTHRQGTNQKILKNWTICSSVKLLKVSCELPDISNFSQNHSCPEGPHFLSVFLSLKKPSQGPPNFRKAPCLEKF